MSRWTIVVTVAAVAGVASGLGVALGATGASKPGGSRLPVAQLVAIARGSLAGLRDPTVRVASVVATRRRIGENWMEPGSISPTPAGPRAYLIVLRGRFICDSCSFPAGAKPPRGRSAQLLWIPGVGVTDGGLTRTTPPGLSKLGRVVTIRLTPPHVPAAALAVRAGSGIGSVRLGALLRTVDEKLGPAIAPGHYVLGPIDIFIRSDRHHRVDQIAVASPEATIDGHQLGEGYAHLERVLAGWRARSCGHGVRVLVRQDRGKVSTRLEFAENAFNLAFIGVVAPGTCIAPFN